MCYQTSDFGEGESTLILLSLSDPELCLWKGNKAIILVFPSNISYNKKIPDGNEKDA